MFLGVLLLSDVDVFSFVDFQPIRINGRNREREQISLQHKLKPKSSGSEIIVRIGLEMMQSCGFTYGDTVYLQYGLFVSDHVVKITKQSTDSKFPATLSRQNKSENSAGVVRFTFKNGIGFPDFLSLESASSNEQLTKVKYLHDDLTIQHSDGDCTFKLKLSSSS